MSCDIRMYRTIKEGFDDAKDLTLTAFVGPEENRRCIQFTIGHEYTCLSETQLLDLIEVIAKRLTNKDGFTPTGYSKPKIILPDGTSENERNFDTIITERHEDNLRKVKEMHLDGYYSFALGEATRKFPKRRYYEVVIPLESSQASISLNNEKPIPQEDRYVSFVFEKCHSGIYLYDVKLCKVRKAEI